MITNTTKLCGFRATPKTCDPRVNKQKILSNTNIMKEMKKDDLSKLSKSQLIKLLFKQNLEMKKLSTKRNIIQPPLEFRNDYKSIPTPRKNVKQMIKSYEDNIIQPPLEFRDKPIPIPRKSVKQMVQDYEENIILPPLEFRDDYKTVPFYLELRNLYLYLGLR